MCVSGTSASPGMAGCLSVSLLRGDQGHNKLAHYTPQSHLRVFVCLCVCLCGEQANMCVCVCVCTCAQRRLLVCFSGTLWLRVASAVEMPSLLPLFPPSLLLLIFFLCLPVFSLRLSHLRPSRTRIFYNINRINCMFQPSQQLLLFTQVTSQRVMLTIFYIYLIVNKSREKNNNIVL